MDHSLAIGLKDRIYWIADRIAIGQFATPQRAEVLKAQGITDILNVGEAASLPAVRQMGFRSVVDVPITDLALITKDVAISSLDAMNGVISTQDAKLYVHCVACQNRSPTILWLFLLACGFDGFEAKKLITDRCPDAIPGHSLLVDSVLVDAVRIHGSVHGYPSINPLSGAVQKT